MGKNWKSYLMPGIAVVCAIVAWTWHDLQNKPANEKIMQNLQKLLQEEPGLQPVYDRLNADGKITIAESQEFIAEFKKRKGE